MSANFPTAESAAVYQQAHDKRVKDLYRKTMPALRAIAMGPRTPEGQQWVSTLGKDDLITEIVGIEFPVAMLNEAIHARFHRVLTNSACQHCQQQESDR